MRSKLFVQLALLVMCGAAPAQEPVITAETPVDYAVLHQWLHSGDPRLVAWAASFARDRHDKTLVGEMPSLLEHWAIPRRDNNDAAQAAERRAAEAVVDAVIQEKVPVSVPVIDSLAEVFPVQAAILIGRLPLSEARSELGDWTLGQKGPGSRMLARIASMMLAKDPKLSQGIWNRSLVGFVAGVVAASEEDLQITVQANSEPSHVGYNEACEDGLPRKAVTGWPQVYAYYLSEHDPQGSGPDFVELDGDRITSHRRDENASGGSCFRVDPLNSFTRHRIIAYWLGVKEQEMSWQPVTRVVLVWTNESAYQRKLGRIVEGERQKLHSTVEVLRQRGLMTSFDAPLISPRLMVTVICEMNPCPLR